MSNFLRAHTHKTYIGHLHDLYFETHNCSMHGPEAENPFPPKNNNLK